MASSPITSWQIDGETMETVTDFIFLGSKIPADDDCSHEIKRYLFLGRQADKPIQCIKKQRHHFANKGPCSQSYGFSSCHVQMWELDHKKAEHWRTDALELWCWRTVLKIPWTARGSNQSVLKEINPEIHWKDWGWNWSANILAACWSELTHLKRPWCGERLRQEEMEVAED